MQDDPRYDDVVSEVAAFLEERLRFAVAAGIPEERICLDPGIGFGKTVEHNFELLRRLDELVALGRPVVVGVSRKRSLGRLLGDPEATTGSLAASVGAAVAAYAARRDDPARARRPRARRGARGRPGRGRSGGGRSGSSVSCDYLPPRDVRSSCTASRSSAATALLPEERTGQTFLYDIELETSDAALSDRIEDAVDYREVAELVRVVSEERRFDLLEPLAAAVADVLLARFDVDARARAGAQAEAVRDRRRVVGGYRRAAPVTLTR